MKRIPLTPFGRLTIFSRLVLGNVLVLVIAAAVSIYPILQLDQMRKVTHRIIEIHNVLIDLDKEMTGALLSEIHCERKFSLLQDRALYKGFLSAKSEFDTSLKRAQSMADIPNIAAALTRIQSLNETYYSLFEKEVSSLDDGTPFGKKGERDKRRAANQTMKELTQLKALSQQRILLKLKELDDAGSRASTVVIGISGAALIFGIALSVLITRSITLPLSRMKKKTAEVASGVFEADLDLKSPPEIRALAQAFNTMCLQLKEVDRIKTEFYSLMSHELRTPLTSIREGTDMFLEGVGGEVTERQRELLVIMSEESTRLLTLVNGLLDLSRLESGVIPFHPSTCEMAPLISQTIREVAPLAASKQISIESSLAEIPPLWVDSERILHALRNLVGNALKFTPPQGTVRVTLERTETEVRVSVEDSGPGIGKDEMGFIFDKFRQASAGGRLKFQGTGLGLAIVKHVVEAHGGRVWVESEVGQGSTFTVALPAYLSR